MKPPVILIALCLSLLSSFILPAKDAVNFDLRETSPQFSARAVGIDSIPPASPQWKRVRDEEIVFSFEKLVPGQVLEFAYLPVLEVIHSDLRYIHTDKGLYIAPDQDSQK